MAEHTDILQLRLNGNGVNPESLKAREVAELLDGLERALYYVVQNQNPAIEEDDIYISLTDVVNESLGLNFTPKLPLIIAGFLTLTRAIESNNYSYIPVRSIEQLQRIAKVAKRKKCNAEFKINNKVEAIIHLDSAIEVPATAYISGSTTIYAYIKRSGGADPTVALRVNPNDNFIYVKTSEEIAKELGKRLYTTVGLVGFATWERGTRQLIDFKIDQILGYRESTHENSFALLRDAFSPYWDNVDNPEEYLMRND